MVFQPAAVVFHDKRLSARRRVAADVRGAFFSAQAALLLAHKWSRDDVVARVTADLRVPRSPSSSTRSRSSAAVRRRSTLVPQRDHEHTVAEFRENGYYTTHRYGL